MARWDDFEKDIESEEESRLLDKFNQYVDLQKEHTDKQKAKRNSRISRNQNVLLAVVEGTILSGLAIAFVVLVSI